MPFEFDIDKLLSPITPDEPAGVNLRYDPVYDQIRELRREDDAALPQGVWKSEQKRADWKAVEAICLDTLETRSKDLQICAWLLEAWLHLYGFGGAAEGFRVMHALCESFWDALHPRIEAGDPEFRIAPIVWLNRRFPAELRLLSITEPAADGVPACTLADWEVACQMENLQNRPGKQPAANERGMHLAKFQQSAMLTPTPVLAARLEDVRDLLHTCGALQQLLDTRMGAESPGMLSVRSAGEDAATLLESLLRERGALHARQTTGEASEVFQYQYSGPDGNDAVNDMELSRPVPGGRIQTRSEAYQMLTEAADFLNRTEPHSPAPYLIRRAISWGSMSLEELLPELVRNQAELGDIYRLLNVRLPAEGKK